MTAIETVRLQKYLAQCGIASRRKAEQLILDGRVTVNGTTVNALGSSIRPGRDVVCFDGNEVEQETDLCYYLLNKPSGYVTSTSDPQGRPVVTSLIEKTDKRLFPVGRLDFDTEGALLLTNDGELAQRIQHPKFQTNKTYQATVYGHPGKARLKNLEKGLIIDQKRTAPASVKIIKKRASTSIINITIHEGRKHQVKKMFEEIGHPVVFLKRIAYGQLRLGNLPTGASRKLSQTDIKKIFL